MIQVFVDLDGVLADFDTHYERCFGVRPDKALDNVDKRLIAGRPGFFADMPLMPDAMELWGFVSRLRRRPIILTGVPSDVPEAPVDKVLMVHRELGADVRVITCRPSEKAKYCQPGDVLIDDWEKHKKLWLKAGGKWITHTSAESSIAQLLDLGIGL